MPWCVGHLTRKFPSSQSHRLCSRRRRRCRRRCWAHPQTASWPRWAGAARRWLAGGDITGVTTLQSTSQGIFHKTLIISWAQRSGEGLLPSEYATADECSQAQCSLSTQGYYSMASSSLWPRRGIRGWAWCRSSQPGGWGQEVRDDNVITVPVHWQSLMSSVVRNY